MGRSHSVILPTPAGRGDPVPVLRTSSPAVVPAALGLVTAPPWPTDTLDLRISSISSSVALGQAGPSCGVAAGPQKGGQADPAWWRPSCCREAVCPRLIRALSLKGWEDESPSERSFKTELGLCRLRAAARGFTFGENV